MFERAARQDYNHMKLKLTAEAALEFLTRIDRSSSCVGVCQR